MYRKSEVGREQGRTGVKFFRTCQPEGSFNSDKFFRRNRIVRVDLRVRQIVPVIMKNDLQPSGRPTKCDRK